MCLRPPAWAFTVQDGGHAQPITFFEHAESSITVGLVLDSSISMHRKRDAVIAAGNKFAESSHPDDEMFTINFNERVWPGLPPGRSFTSDREELRRALQRSGARGKTALFDALHAALTHLQSGRRQKKVLIVVSDGGKLQHVRSGERIVVTTTEGRYEYVVRETRVVKPRDVWVLDPTDEPSLTLVTCHPFNFIGAAPDRFIVRASLVDYRTPR